MSIVSVSLALLFLIKLRCGASVNTINYFVPIYLVIEWWFVYWYIYIYIIHVYLLINTRRVNDIINVNDIFLCTANSIL